MNFQKWLILGLVITGFFCPATVQAYGANQQLKVFCSSPHDLDYGYCAGFVTAIADIMISNSVEGYRACNHNLVQSQQLVDIVRKAFRQTPAGVTAPHERTVIAKALSEAFPCY